MGRNDLDRCGTVASAVRDSAKAYFGLDGIVKALGNMPEIVRDRAIDEVVSGMIDRIDAAPHDPAPVGSDEALGDDVSHRGGTGISRGRGTAAGGVNAIGAAGAKPFVSAG